jgi:hypothetical protein
MERSVEADLLEHPGAWRDLARLVKVRPSGDVLTAHVELVGTEATVSAPIVGGSRPFWTTGFDLAVAAIEDADAGGSGRIPDVEEIWTFTFGDRLPRLRAVAFPDGWRWDPRRASTYRSRDGRTWGHLPLLLSAMRIGAKRDPAPSTAAIRRSGVLKISTVAASFGMFSATSERADVRPGERHRVITSDGVVPLMEGRAERPGPWAFPPAAALVEGAGRLLLTLLMHEVRARSGPLIQVDTDGAYIGALFAQESG